MILVVSDSFVNWKILLARVFQVIGPAAIPMAFTLTAQAYFMSINIAFLTLILVVFTGCVAHVYEDMFIHSIPGNQLIDGMVSGTQWEFRSHYISRPKNVQLYAVLFARPAPKALILYFGGNSFMISKYYQRILDAYENQPVDVLLVDHRGYGGSTGVASMTGLLEDATAVYDYARNLPNYQNNPVIVHGQSLGSFMAGEVSKVRTLDGLVLESSATTVEDWLQGFVDDSVFISRGVVEGSLKGKGNLSVMASLDEHVLLVVGEKDTMTRSDMSAKLFKTAGVPSDWKELLVVPGAGHKNAALSEEYSKAFTRLLIRIGHINSR